METLVHHPNLHGNHVQQYNLYSEVTRCCNRLHLICSTICFPLTTQALPKKRRGREARSGVPWQELWEIAHVRGYLTRCPAPKKHFGMNRMLPIFGGKIAKSSFQCRCALCPGRRRQFLLRGRRAIMFTARDFLPHLILTPLGAAGTVDWSSSWVPVAVAQGNRKIINTLLPLL